MSHIEIKNETTNFTLKEILCLLNMADMQGDKPNDSHAILILLLKQVTDIAKR